jgi:hypothetical protein
MFRVEDKAKAGSPKKTSQLYAYAMRLLTVEVGV